MNLLWCSSGGQKTDASLSRLMSMWWWGQRSFWRFQGRKCLPGFPQLLEAAGILSLSAPSFLCPQSTSLWPLLLSPHLLLPTPPNSLCDDISPPGQSTAVSLFHNLNLITVCRISSIRKHHLSTGSRDQHVDIFQGLLFTHAPMCNFYYDALFCFFFFFSLSYSFSFR